MPNLKLLIMIFCRVGSIFIALGILVASLFSSCTTNIKRSTEQYIEKGIEVDSFSKIKLEGAYNVKLIQGTQSAILVNTSEELHENLTIYSENNTLYVKTRVKNLGTDEIKLDITVNKLEEIDIEGGVFLTNDEYINTSDLSILLKGGAHIDLKLHVDNLFAKTEGGINIEFEGTANKFTAISEGAGNIDADKLEAKEVICRVAGVGNASIFATEKLDATVEGLGKIGYRGNPTISKQVNGIGLVYRK